MSMCRACAKIKVCNFACKITSSQSLAAKVTAQGAQRGSLHQHPVTFRKISAISKPIEPITNLFASATKKVKIVKPTEGGLW